MAVDSKHFARWWHLLPDGRLQCDLCPRDCQLHAGQRGACFVRQNLDGRMVLTTYGRSSGFCIDPIEKKPLNHFYPGSSVLSFGTAGCNLTCRFCQNWDISKAKDMDRLMDHASPQAIASAARPGKISIHSEADDEGIHISIQDDGVGMSAEQQARAFEPFYTTRPVGSGAGLGLSSARNIVLAHSGRISIQSRPDAGTRVNIFLPVPK